jgi:methylglutaconyl-CoA hydratase
MMGDYERIRYEVDGGVGAILLNRPEKRNAIDARLIEELQHVLEVSRTDESVRVLSLTGAGKDFCSGADLASLRKMKDAGVMANMEDARGLANLLLAMRRHPKLIVALVRGRALAGGCGLATGCDLVVAEESASFGYPEVNIGFVPAMVMSMLRRAVSEKRALELIVTGAVINASYAKEIGLINQVFTSPEFEERSVTYVQDLAARSASAVTLSKSLLYHMDSLSFETALEAGLQTNAIARMTDDCKSGIERFLRKP